VYSVEVAAPPGGGCRAREASAAAQVHVPAALAWRDFMVSGYSDADQQRLAGGPGYRPAARHGPTGRHLWCARDPAGLQATLNSLPLDAWVTVQTRPLTPLSSGRALAAS